MPQRTPPPALLVLTTLPQRDAAEALARQLLNARLAACVHLGAPVQSLYHWRGQIETAAETPLAIKTLVELYPKVQATNLPATPTNFPRSLLSPSPMPCLPTSSGSLRKPPPRSDRAWRALWGLAALVLAAPSVAQVNPLPPEKAFRFSARALNPQTVEARFNIADGYYLYRDKVHFVVEPAASGLVAPSLPAGKIKEDQFFGRVETYRGNVIVNLQLEGTTPGQKVVVQAESQGCADLGICYPPTIQRVTVALPAAGSAPTNPDEAPRKQWFQ